MIVFSPILNDLKILFFRDTSYMYKGIHRARCTWRRMLTGIIRLCLTFNVNNKDEMMMSAK